MVIQRMFKLPHNCSHLTRFHDQPKAGILPEITPFLNFSVLLFYFLTSLAKGASLILSLAVNSQLSFFWRIQSKARCWAEVLFPLYIL